MSPFKLNFTRKEVAVIIALCLLKLIIHLYFDLASGLHRDAYLYLAFSDHLAWGYASVPPFIGVVSWVIDLISGESNFWARIFPTIAGVISVFLIAMLVKELGGKINGILLAALAFIFSPVFLRVHSLLQPVPFDQLFWLAGTFLLVRMINTGDKKLWYAVFIIWAIGFLNKYLIALLLIAVLISLLLSRHRKLLFSKHFLIAGFFALLMISPNLYWQYAHHFPVMHHMKELQQTQLVNVSPVSFLLDQAVINLHAIILLIFSLVALLFFKSESRFRFIGIAYLMLLLLLLLLRGKNYYTLGFYPILYAFGGYSIEKYFTGRWIILRNVILATMVLLPLPYIPITSMPFMSYPYIEKYCKVLHFDVVTRWEDGKQHPIPQDFADMTGWPELSQIVHRTYFSLPVEERNATIILTGNYGEAGSIKYYGKKDDIPEPISFNDSFLLWAPDSLQNIRNMILVDWDTSTVRKLFKEVTLAGKVNNRYFRENTLPVYLCKDPLPGLYEKYKEDAYRKKSDIHWP